MCQSRSCINWNRTIPDCLTWDSVSVFLKGNIIFVWNVSWIVKFWFYWPMHTKGDFICFYCNIYVLWRKCDAIERYPVKICGKPSCSMTVYDLSLYASIKSSELIFGGFHKESGGWIALSTMMRWVSQPNISKKLVTFERFSL